MKEYQIGIFEEVSGYLTVKANSKEEAEKEALKLVGDNGVYGVKDELDMDMDITHRDIYLV